jgi:hypothetical protein
MDTHMLVGCTSFVAASFVSYGLSIWPFFLVPEQHLAANFLFAMAAGLLPSLAFSAFCARKAGLAGACGFFGGATAAAIFLHLHLTQLLIGQYNRELPKPEYNDSWKWLMPGIWLLAALIVSLLFLPKNEIGHSTPTEGRR